MSWKELTPKEQVIEIHDEFLLEAANYSQDQDPELRARALVHVNALLDAYLDLWPELAYQAG